MKIGHVIRDEDNLPVVECDPEGEVEPASGKGTPFPEAGGSKPYSGPPL